MCLDEDGGVFFFLLHETELFETAVPERGAFFPKRDAHQEKMHLCLACAEWLEIMTFSSLFSFREGL